jgi:hypothetical protein
MPRVGNRLRRVGQVEGRGRRDRAHVRGAELARGSGSGLVMPLRRASGREREGCGAEVAASRKPPPPVLRAERLWQQVSEVRVITIPRYRHRWSKLHDVIPTSTMGRDNSNGSGCGAELHAWPKVWLMCERSMQRTSLSGACGSDSLSAENPLLGGCGSRCWKLIRTTAFLFPRNGPPQKNGTEWRAWAGRGGWENQQTSALCRPVNPIRKRAISITFLETTEQTSYPGIPPAKFG